MAFSEYMNFISFTSYKQPMRILKYNEILFIYFLSKYLQDKSFKQCSKYIKKRQYNCLNKKNENTSVHLRLMTMIFMFRNIGCWYELNKFEHVLVT